MNIYELHNRLIKRASAVEEKLNEEDKKKKPNEGSLAERIMNAINAGVGATAGGLGGAVLSDTLSNLLSRNELIPDSHKVYLRFPGIFFGSAVGAKLLPWLLK